jgi:hypothetical protein
MLILKSFKFFVLKLLILKGLRADLTKVRILKELGVARGKLTANSLQLTAVEEGKGER